MVPLAQLHDIKECIVAQILTNRAADLVGSISIWLITLNYQRFSYIIVTICVQAMLRKLDQAGVMSKMY